MNRATTTANDPDFEQVLLSNAEMCYSVALALTRNPGRALALAKETLLWAWHLDGGEWDAGGIKRKLLSELRGRYMRRYRVAPVQSASGRRQLQEAGI